MYSGHDDQVVALTRCGPLLISVSKDSTARVWCLASTACIATLEGHEYEITCMAVAHIGTSTLLVTGSADATARSWPLDQLLARYGGSAALFNLRCVRL